MKDCKLIIVEGIPGTGKSTMAQFITEQLIKNIMPVQWYHEGLEDHFIWNALDEFFNEDGYVFEENFEKYTNNLIERFEVIKATVEETKQVFVLDGDLLAGFTNVLFKSDCALERIKKLYDRIEKTIQPMNPLLIYLDTNRVRSHTIETWENRALWGKKVVIESYGKIPHVKRSGSTGDDILYTYINPLHDLDLIFLKYMSIDHLRFNIDKRNYKEYQKIILSYLELPYYKPIQDKSVLNRFVGIYDNERDQKNMFVKIKDNLLVCDWGQMNMVLNYVKPNVYNLRSYPINLKFIEEENKIVGIETYGEQCFRRAGCHFNRVEETKYEIRK